MTSNAFSEYARRLRKVDFLDQITARSVKDHLGRRREVASINDGFIRP